MSEERRLPESVRRQAHPVSGEADRSAAALAAAEDSIARYRKLAAAEPSYRTALAAALLHTGQLLARSDRPAEALTRCEDAVARYRALAQEDPAVGPQLATALSGLAEALHRGGSLSRALLVSEEAEKIHQRLADTDLWAFTKAAPQRTALTHQRALLLAEAGRHKEALVVAEHTVRNLRQLRPQAPQSRTPQLAAALATLSAQLGHAGRTTEAVAAAEEAIDLYRPLIATRHDLLARYSTTLHELGALLAKADRRADARPYLTEALDHHRHLARSDPGQWLPAAARTVHELRSLTTSAGTAWGTPREIDLRARRLRRQRNWPELWEFILSVPVADAVRVVRQLPRHWRPTDARERSLVARLRVAEPRPLAHAARALGRTAVIRTDDHVLDARRLSFARARPLLALATVTKTGTEQLRLVHTDTGERTPLYEGPARHGSFVVLPSGDVLAIRTRTRPSGQPGRPSGSSGAGTVSPSGPWELIRYAAGRADRVGDGALLGGATAVATADGYVIGLRLRSGALLSERGSALREVDLAPFGLGRGDVVAADPTGTRLAFADGPRVVLTDTALTTAIAMSMAPPDHGNVEELVFVSTNELVTVGDRGSVFLWQAVDGQLLMVAEAKNPPRLRQLFSVPAWRTVGGWAPSRKRVYSFDTATLTARGLPRPSRRPPRAVAASPDGRYLAYATIDRFGRGGRGARVEVQDLLHPTAAVERPLATLAAAELEPSWGALGPLPTPDQCELLLLAQTAAGLRPAPEPTG
ncbi:tetratricopeptide repeat protein [Streptomyces albipurpureus]|uniref:Tetratricopeptide repeat protein n=1 Tax=Streptomyces albipurpureus TaxID=2897419 RepID=A0ABT0UJ92_9ACTN|nr:tetratricopeptide repeat protein [Streptomyces sp. CWNU-1]MCM2388714.1 tetratricopeptide repeat protein [Streptomyces sp. CWNU-1]